MFLCMTCPASDWDGASCANKLDSPAETLERPLEFAQGAEGQPVAAQLADSKTDERVVTSNPSRRQPARLALRPPTSATDQGTAASGLRRTAFRATRAFEIARLTIEGLE
jgi:hypothetical protein